MQRLAQNPQINAVGINRRVLQIATRNSNFQAILFRLGRDKRDDLFGIVHGDDFLAAAREQFHSANFACAQIATDPRRKMRNSKCPNACHERPGP